MTNINTDTPASLLKKVFGYDSFRTLQKEIIANVLEKKDTLAIMPTGGGKSLCYQIPALIFDGLTIVISPLISLMKDQVEQLNHAGVNAVMLNSSLSYNIYLRHCELIREGRVSLLYLAPETLVKEDVIELLNEVKIDCLTIDEAHCISEWGHDFRPEYRQLGEYRRKFPDAVCLALTATATPRVQDDIIQCLNFSEENKFISSFDRSNLFLQVLPKNNPLNQTMEFLNQHKDESGIIYCATRDQVDELTARLSAKKLSVKPYHAGLSDTERENNQTLFSNDDIQIIVATIAFGMGINKSNVRFVIHYDLPKNLESYYQEIGRSGRDGLRADCLLLFGYGDIRKINYFIELKENEEEKKIAKSLLQEMIRYAESKICRRLPLLNHFGETVLNNSCDMCDNCTTEHKDLQDITVEAQKFLSAVKRTGEIFGSAHIIDILTGSDTEKIRRFGHNRLSVYGIGAEYTKNQWFHLFNQFTQYGLIARDVEHGSLKLTEKAAGILFGGGQINGTVEAPEFRKKKEPVTEEFEFNPDLFTLLKKKRKEIAASEGVPPYVIFSDKTLREMSQRQPQDEMDFLGITGVGTVKLDKYGKTFLKIINNYLRNK